MASANPYNTQQFSVATSARNVSFLQVQSPALQDELSREMAALLLQSTEHATSRALLQSMPTVVISWNADIQFRIQSYLFASELKATAGMSNSWAVSAGNALHERSQWLFEDYVDLTWCDLQMLLSKLRNLKVLDIDADGLVAHFVDDDDVSVTSLFSAPNWEPQLSQARDLIADVVRSNELLHVSVCNNSFNDDRLDEYDYDFIDLLRPVTEQLLSLRTETSDFNMDLANTLQSCRKLKQLDVPNISFARICDRLEHRPYLPALPMLEQLRVRDIGTDVMVSLLADAYGRVLSQRLPRLREVTVERGLTHVQQCVIDEASTAIRFQPCMRSIPRVAML